MRAAAPPARRLAGHLAGNAFAQEQTTVSLAWVGSYPHLGSPANPSQQIKRCQEKLPCDPVLKPQWRKLVQCQMLSPDPGD
jgi:hypothetical protein